MKLTYKGIARAAAYRVHKEYTMAVTDYKWLYRWFDTDNPVGTYSGWFESEDEAWEACCRVCGLVAPSTKVCGLVEK